MSSGTPDHDLFAKPSLEAQLRRASTSAAAPVTVIEGVPTPADGRSVVPGGDAVATLTLWARAWDAAALSDLCRSMKQGPSGRRLIFVEPVAAAGWRRQVQRLAGPLWQRRLGHRFDRDLPVELRRAGFKIGTLDRFAQDRLGLMTYAYGEAGVDQPNR